MSTTVIIGLEVHVQLLTKSKLFCGCTTEFRPDDPNTQTCPVCIGMPGALPVMNRRAFELSLKTALALNCEIAAFTKWDRKQYFYPDLPKAYQISQYDLPFSHDGFVEIAAGEDDDTSGERRTVRLIRAHLEEDAGKNLHDESGGQGDSRVDLNRTGTPLLEIVSEPDIRCAAEARRFLEELRLLLSYIGVSDCNMQEGSLRCDANINLHIAQDDGSILRTPIVEIKNLNSFRNVEAAIDYEVKRQTREVAGGSIASGVGTKVTRGWDAERGTTFLQRGKEEAADYRYFPDPDLVPVTVTQDQINTVRDSLCELPAVRRARFESERGLSDYDAKVIIDQGPELADYFETVADACGNGKTASNWVTQDVLRDLKAMEVTLREFPITAEILGTLLARIEENTLTTRGGREVYAALLKKSSQGSALTAGDVDTIVREEGLAVVEDTAALDQAIVAAIENFPTAAEDVRNGKQAAVGPMIGFIMKQLGNADPKTVRGRLLERLGQ